MDSMLFLMLLACSVTGAPPSLFPLEPPSNLLEMYPPERVLETGNGGELSDDRLEELEETLNDLLKTGEDPPVVLIDDDVDDMLLEPQPPFPLPYGFLPFLNPEGESEEVEDDVIGLPRKRSRYYRRYTGKRQTKYHSPDNYLCSPTRDDVYRLLVALHEVRNGTMDKTVHFCNRRRPAKAVFTNIRFLGRRR